MSEVAVTVLIAIALVVSWITIAVAVLLIWLDRGDDELFPQREDGTW